MDLFEKLGKQISEITVYDVKSAYEKAKNAVMNYTEMEAKVREATNDDPWGASSTLMQEIAESTFNYAHFNEIMPVIYKRFTEKEASEWRQIYKALQLLEYIIKHGSERVVDDARSHLSMIKMLRNFHFIDDKGKDQGINVRNRSKELAELLSDLDRVRQERRKAKANRNKYKGVGNDSMSPSFTSSSGSRYGGFGSDAYPSHSGPPSSSFGNDSYPSSSARDTARRESFDEYDAGDDEVRSPAAASAPPARKSTNSTSSSAPRPVKKDPPPPAAPAKAVNLFDFEDDEPAAAPAPAAAAAKPTHARTMSFDDDFDDFQSAAPAAAATAPVQASMPQHAPARAATSSNFFDMMAPSASSAPLTPVTCPPPSSNNMGYSAQPQLHTSHNMPAGPNYSGVGMFANSTHNGAGARPGMMSAQSASSIPTSSSAIAPKPAASKAGAFDFDDLFAASGAKASASNANKSASQGGANSMANLAAQKSSSAIWGGSGATASGGNAYGGSSSNNNDLLF